MGESEGEGGGEGGDGGEGEGEGEGEAEFLFIYIERERGRYIYIYIYLIFYIQYGNIPTRDLPPPSLRTAPEWGGVGWGESLMGTLPYWT